MEDFAAIPHGEIFEFDSRKEKKIRPTTCMEIFTQRNRRQGYFLGHPTQHSTQIKLLLYPISATNS